jgi:anthranilate/para-aminobenzoate synthase component II
MILVLDNYDSFTYNLVQYLGELGAALKVVRNDEATSTRWRHEPARSYLARALHAE